MRTNLTRRLPSFTAFNEAAQDDALFERVFGEQEAIDRNNSLPQLPSDDVFLVSHRMARPTPFHTHDYSEFAYVLRGRLINHVDGRAVHMLKDSLCVMREGTSHALEVVDSDAIVVNVCLRRGLFETGVFRNFLQEEHDLPRMLSGHGRWGHMIYSDASGRSIWSAVIALLREYDASGYRDSYAVRGRVLVLLDRLLRSEDFSFHGMDERTAEIVQRIERECSTITVSQLARDLGYNESYFSQLMRAKTGRTPLALITGARMRKARRLLSETDLSSTDVAREVGYQSYSHFHKLYTRTYGATPAVSREFLQRSQ